MTYKKILTVHSEDRDINMYPESNQFEVILPDSYANISQINLLNITMSNKFYNISKYYANNILNINYNNTEHIILIPDGYYTGKDLQDVLNIYFLHNNIKILAYYNNTDNKFYFITNEPNISFDFTTFSTSENLDCKDINYNKIISEIRYQYNNWGFGYNIGFSTAEKYDFSKNKLIDTEEHIYEFDINLVKLILSDLSNIYLKQSYDSFSSTLDLTNFQDLYVLIPENNAHLDINNTIYMEIDKYNYCDEIKPYQYNSNTLYCNDYNGYVNNFFSKIIFDSNNILDKIIATNSDGNIVGGEFNNNSFQKIRKLRFKFRYHNGFLIDFRDNFNFTLEFICNQ